MRRDLHQAFEFLTGDPVHHICWVDNSDKRGAGRLRRVSGKLLWW